MQEARGKGQRGKGQEARSNRQEARGTGQGARGKARLGGACAHMDGLLGQLRLERRVEEAHKVAVHALVARDQLVGESEPARVAREPREGLAEEGPQARERGPALDAGRGRLRRARGQDARPVWKSTTGLGRPDQTLKFSSSAKSKSIRLIFGRIDCSRRVLEAQRKCLCQNGRMRARLKSG